MHPGAKCSNEAIPLAKGPAVAAGPFTDVPSMNDSLVRTKAEDAPVTAAEPRTHIDLRIDQAS